MSRAAARAAAPAAGFFGALMAMISIVSTQAQEVRLITLDPGHFHAGLVQKLMYPQVDAVVHVYAPPGPDLQEHLRRIESYNTRAEAPTHWREVVHAGPDFLEEMLREKAGNVVVLSGNNLRKTEYIDRCIKAGFNVLADKPMAINPAEFSLLREDLALAGEKKLLLCDLMTERNEITTILQRALARAPEVFGTLTRGDAAHPAVAMESVHHFFKEVSGQPLLRPAWFFDVRQQGEAIPDVGTHLVDLVQWECFPDRALDWKKDIHLHSARRWPTLVTPAQFQRATGLAQYPDYLKGETGPDGNLSVYQNGDVNYSICGVEAKLTALWRFEAPPGGGDTHYARLIGTRAILTIEQGAAQHYQTALYVEYNGGASAADFARALRAAVERLSATWPGLEVRPAGARWEIIVPAKYRVGHEAHFAQVTQEYLRFLAGGAPGWVVPNLLAKYYTTTEAWRLSHVQ